MTVLSFPFVRAGDAGPDAFAAAAAAEAQAYEAIIPGTLKWEAGNLREGGRNIDGLSEAVASQLLWLAAQAPARIETLQFLGMALSSPTPAIRRQAADILAASGTDDAVRLVAGRLESEPDGATAMHMIECLAAMPDRRAVTALVELVLRNNARPEILHAAAENLRRLTRANVPDNPLAWRDWWLDNMPSYR